MNTTCLGKLPRSRIASLFSVLLLACGLLLHGTAAAQASPEDSRKVKKSVPAEYPELARQMNIRGLARVMVTITPEGAVKEVKEVGGHPLLIDALVRAVKKWKYEPAAKESIIEVKAEFGAT